MSVKMFGLESAFDYYNGNRYRWYSKYNGARGAWSTEKSIAEKGGAEHESIIRSLFNKDEIDNSHTTGAAGH